MGRKMGEILVDSEGQSCVPLGQSSWGDAAPVRLFRLEKRILSSSGESDMGHRGGKIVSDQSVWEDREQPFQDNPKHTPVTMASQKQQPKLLSPALSLVSGGSAACIAEITTLPFDTGKVRLQVLGEQLKKGAARPGMFQILGTIAKEEGPRALWKGLSPGLQRQMAFASIRIGLYEPVRNMIAGPDTSPNMLQRISAGLLTGAVGITVANPTDVVKIRLQAEGRRPAGVAPR